MKVMVDFEKLHNLKNKYDEFIDFCSKQDGMNDQEIQEIGVRKVAGMQLAIENLFKED
jgi:hypothetical protein